MKLQLGLVCIHIEGLTIEEIPMNARLFLTDERTPAEVHYRFHGVDTLPQPGKGWKEVFQRPDICVWQCGKLEARRLAVGTPDAAYALYQETDEQTIEVYYLQALKSDWQIDTIFASCLALERQMAKHQAYILHSCYLNHRGQGILFSGPSGIGKSTHAQLWCRRYTDTHVVNGDRCLVYKDEQGRYKACPWLVCGSSGICLTEERPLQAIVFMGQAPQNEVVPTRPMQLYKMLSSQLTINWWNTEFTRTALDAAQDILEQVGLCTYACNLQPEAPEKLNDYLKEQGWIN